jgi:hypothetical protein
LHVGGDGQRQLLRQNVTSQITTRRSAIIYRARPLVFGRSLADMELPKSTIDQLRRFHLIDDG